MKSFGSTTVLMVSTAARTYGFEPVDILAQILVESDNNPFAFRYELNYFENYIRPNSAAKGYRYGPLAACSFGLLQIMLETALELGFTGAPEELFIPQTGLDWGLKNLRKCFDRGDGTMGSAFAQYNGGARGNLKAPYRNAPYVQRIAYRKPDVEKLLNA